MSFTIVSKKHLNRRAFLRGSGVALALPWLDAMRPAFASAAEKAPAPRRFVAMCATLGIHQPFFTPKETGRDYTLTPYLEILKDYRNDLTIFSGLSHANQSGANGHTHEMTWLTSAPRPGLPGFRNTVSLDQIIAEKFGIQTRFPYLALTSGGGSESMSWSSNGVTVPAMNSPSKIFTQFFVAGTPKEVQEQVKSLERGRSILDTVGGEAKKLERSLGKPDQEKLDEYLTAVRGLETRLKESQGWTTKPKPKVDAKVPTEITNKNDYIAKIRQMYDLMALALRTDSTRSITYRLPGPNSVPVVEGVTEDWHNLSHHGQDERKLKELGLIEKAEFAALADFMKQLKNVKEDGETVLDRTAILYGSNLGNSSSHDWHNLPVMVAGGGFKHGSHIAADPKNNTAFSNLFVALAQRTGVETDKFGHSTSSGIKGFA